MSVINKAKSGELSVQATVQMKELLDQKHVCKDIARSYSSVKEVMFQLQQDIATDENRDEVGPTILAMRKIMDTLFVFKTKGDLFIEQENKQDAKQ